MNLVTLRSYILEHHAELATARRDADIAAAVNAAAGTRYVSTFINERTILAAFQNPADGETLLQTLEAVAAQQTPISPLVARVVRWMRPSEQGIDIGHANTRAMMATLVQAGVLTQTQVNTLLALAARPSSAALDTFGEAVTSAQVSAALNLPEA